MANEAVDGGVEVVAPGGVQRQPAGKLVAADRNADARQLGEQRFGRNDGCRVVLLL
jgi:hypothetical protein